MVGLPLAACAYDSIVGPVNLDWGTGLVVAGVGATSMLRSERAFSICGLNTTGCVEVAWMTATMASMESMSDSRCSSWSARTLHDVADNGNVEGGLRLVTSW